MMKDLDLRHLDDPNPPEFGTDTLTRVKKQGAEHRRRRRATGSLFVALVAVLASAIPLTNSFTGPASLTVAAQNEGVADARYVLVVHTSTERELDSSESLIVLRVDGGMTVQVLVVPRDLRARDLTTGATSKLGVIANSGDWQALRTAIDAELGIEVDSVVAVDDGTLVDWVDAVNGIEVALPAAARDVVTGFAIDRGGCHRLDGESAVALMYSRHLETRGATGWQSTKPVGDLGRANRQVPLLGAMLEASVLDADDRDGSSPYATLLTDNVVTVPEPDQGHAPLPDALAAVRDVVGTVLPVDEVTSGSGEVGLNPSSDADQTVARFISGRGGDQAERSAVSPCPTG